MHACTIRNSVCKPREVSQYQTGYGLENRGQIPKEEGILSWAIWSERFWLLRSVLPSGQLTFLSDNANVKDASSLPPLAQFHGVVFRESLHFIINMFISSTVKREHDYCRNH
jgi:hypothetical protein